VPLTWKKRRGKRKKKIKLQDYRNKSCGRDVSPQLFTFLLLRKVYQKGDRLLFSFFEKRCLIIKKRGQAPSKNEKGASPLFLIITAGR
jgi:hypothetical protein